MAIYTTLFLCSPDGLIAGFPGWKPPLGQPVRREFRNPFTGTMTVIETREPEWASEDAVDETISHFREGAVHGGFKDYLESRLSPFVRECPHWAAKGLTDLKPLLRAVQVSDLLEHPIYGPPSRGAMIQQLPREFIDKMANIEQTSVAEKWAAEMSAPIHTHSVSGKRINEGWTTDQAMQALSPIVSLVKKATQGQSMYFLVEP
jgi:hypothetical protein